MDTAFLIISLFVPRWMLLSYYANGWIPANIIPLWLDAGMSVFLPRFLILLYIFQNLGADNGWFIAHLIVLLFVYTRFNFGSSED